jgi:hypothetical protein
MVTQKPVSNSLVSPTTPKRVWRPKPATSTEGIPSMFAAASLSKPLKVNTAASSVIRRKTMSATTATAMSENGEKQVGSFGETTATTTSPIEMKSTIATDASKLATKTAKEPTTKVAAYQTKSAPAAIATQAQPTVSTRPTSKTTPSRPVTKSQGVTKPVRTNSSGTSKVTGFGSTSVAGTPQSWPKPHAVPASEKQPIAAKKKKQSIRNQFSNTQEAVQIAPTSMDDLIPEMYRKKSAAQLAKEQQDEIYAMKKIMWELQRQERDREERALMAATKPIDGGVQEVMRKLKEAKEINNDCDSHASSLDGRKKSKDAYSKHVESKLAYFNSNHSVSLDSNWDDDNSDNSSTDSSWDSDASGDGLFR